MDQAYSEEFYSGQQEGSARSADLVIPIVQSVFPITSVIDVGCGVGGWLAAFADRGVEDFLGVDGDYVPRSALKIPADRFLSRDLRNFDGVGRRFDLACSLEVAEHLPEECAARFVAALVRAAPVVLFSASIPGQGGTSHLNEQWQAYWFKLFAAHDYLCLDLVRPALFDNEGVEWWYRQNILLFCERDRLPQHLPTISTSYDLNRVHPRLLEDRVKQPQSGREAATLVWQNMIYLGGSLRRKIGVR